MKKYRTLYHLVWQRVLMYRLATFLFLFFALINIFTSIAVWSIAYKSPQFFSHTPYNTFIAYFLFVLLFHPLAFSYVGDSIADRYIKRGEFSMLLLKPISMMMYLIILELPWRLIKFLFAIPIVILFGIAFRVQVTSYIVPTIGAIIILFFSYFLSFFIQLIFGFFSFWFDDAMGFLNFLEVFMLLFAGLGIPIFFFPPVLQHISAILPFQYMLYFPTMVFLGKISGFDLLRSCGMLLFWLFCLYGIVQIMWKKGLQRFTGEGI